MKVAINAISAKRGGAVTYLQNMLPTLRDRIVRLEGDRLSVWRGSATTGDERWPSRIDYRHDADASGGAGATGGTLRRLWFDQVQLPVTVHRERFDVLFSSANFGPLLSSARHVLLVRNAAYFDPVFMSRMPSRKVRAHYLAQRWLTLRCIEHADVVLFPSRAMLDLVAAHASGMRANWLVAPYGTRHDLFARPEKRAPRDRSGVTQLLNVSLYSDQKNFGTLLRAADVLERSNPGEYKLRLTAGFQQDWMERSPYFPRFSEERTLFRTLEGAGVAQDADWSRYGSLPSLYHSADVFVFPSYIESFGHPLVEAMAAGLPIVAAKVPVNVEICGDAAIYFSPFDAEGLASAVARVRNDEALASRLVDAAIARAAAFTWERHADILAAAMRGRSFD